MKDYMYYQPKNTPRATLLIVHGMAEHQGRYVEFAKFLAKNDIAVMTFNHLGHGEVAKNQGQLGYIGNPNPHERMIEDVMGYAHKLAEKHPTIPHFILGHSMGSFVTRCILGRFGNEFAGAIIMGTSPPNPLVKAFIPLTRLMNRLQPHQPNRIFDRLLGTINNAPFRQEPNLQSFNWLNSNPKRVKDYIADPLCGFAFTNNGFFALMRLMAEGTNQRWWQNVPKTLPMLFVSGKDDSVGQMGKGIPQIINDLQTQGFDDATAIQYDTMRHEILHEDGKQQVFEDILTWLQKHS